MKTQISTGWGSALGLVLVLLPSAAFTATNDLSVTLSKGLFEEEANHNLGAAIQMYQSVVDRFDIDRKLAATAVFRLGECYRKQGSTNEANAQYQRVVTEFADQTALVTLSRQYLATLSGSRAAQAGARGAKPGSGTEERLSNIVELGEISRVEAIIKNSPDLINAPDKSGQTLLQTYAAKGDVSVVELLLEKGAAVNGVKQPDLAPLHFAAGNGHKSVVEILLSKGARVDAVTAAGVTPLHLAVLQGYELVAKALLDSGANVNARVEKETSRSAESLTYTLHPYQTPLHLACQAGYDGLVDLLISKGADLNAQDAKGWTPLTVAAEANNDSMVKTLLSAHADPSIGRWSALALAAGQGSIPMLDLLLSHGANLDLTNALQKAVANNHPAAVARLIQFKADPNMKDEHGLPLVFDALDAPETLRALLDGGADPNQRSSSGDTVLRRAVNGDPELIEMLLAHGADPKAEDIQGFTALHYAAGNSKLDVAQALIKHGANPNSQDKSGDTPLHYAVRSRNQEIVSLLLDHGADPNLRNNNGGTPLDDAKRYDGFPPPIPGLVPGLGIGSSQTTATPSKHLSMQELLLQHGANEDLPRMDRIEVRRSLNYPSTVFTRSTNDLNRFTVLELLAVHYGFISAAAVSGSTPVYKGSSRTIDGALVFPNLDKITIRRFKPGGKGWNEVAVSVQSILDSGDCARDVWLQWGDQVEVPEADHPLREVWTGFAGTMLTNLQHCLKRTVSVTVKGQSNPLTLEANTPEPPFGGVPSIFNYSPPQFGLTPALQRSGLLRTSSDLTRVRVTRHNLSTGENWVKSFDCSSSAPGSPNLWLRDGDVIEVPDKM